MRLLSRSPPRHGDRRGERPDEAEHGLLVSWAGFNTAVTREARQLFFKVRLWDAGNVVNALQANYDKLSKELQAEIPLKRTWILVEDD